MSQDYSQTLNLPKTDFAMRGELPKKEPKMLEEWDNNKTYHKMVERNEGKPLYVLHDGPPYANNSIHLGTALNKILKDFIVKYKNMSGHKAPFIPGWDTHGMPIELKAIKELGIENSVSAVELRQTCKKFALHYIDVQREEFKRLGVLGRYEDPYRSLKPEFEAVQIKIFGEMAKKGYIYKGLKPVYWCPDCQTALAEAEIEYADDPCHSIYVKFKVADDMGKLASMGVDVAKTHFVIWTTTTWTLPGNVAICVNPAFEYVAVSANGEYYIMAKELVESAMKAAKIEDYEIVGSCEGKNLEYIKTQHPFIDRTSLVILGDHVTLESGTGCVHTAPGHGVDDFEVCRNYPELPIIVPVDSQGVLTKEAGEFAGLKTSDANKPIAQKLEELGSLFAIEKINHQYPHCWRCKEPVLFRATEQWFCSVNGFKEEALKAIKDVEWIPGWGEERISGMVRDRSDWCISRQRKWGLPIPIFFCKDCGKPIIDDETINAVSELFAKEGSDAWYIKSAEEILPKDYKCECGCTEFTKETDIMDVWFDSGVTHAAVIDDAEKLPWPVDLYLEGADQYRGWFQSSLLTAVAWRGKAPYKAVCTHGWVVDGEGRKMSKSLGNGIEPHEIIKDYGADILRLWVASSDYHADIRISKDILKQLSDAYRKLRNTARFILGNLNDFNPDTDMVSFDKFEELDKLAMLKLDTLINKVREGYENLEFHSVFHAIHNFCVIDMSSFYLDILKDRLYVLKADSESRRAAQSAMHIILTAITKMLAPIMSFTAEEIWKYIPKSKDMNTGSVLFNDMSAPSGLEFSADFEEKWNKISAIRNDVNKALELKRQEKVIGKSLDAKVTLVCDDKLYNFTSSVTDMLKEIFIVSDVAVVKGTDGEFKGEFEGLFVNAEKAEGELCPRCWSYSKTVGSDSKHPELCERCAKVLK